MGEASGWPWFPGPPPGGWWFTKLETKKYIGCSWGVDGIRGVTEAPGYLEDGAGLGAD